MRGLKSKRTKRQKQKPSISNFRRKVLSLSQILSGLRRQRNQTSSPSPSQVSAGKGIGQRNQPSASKGIGQRNQPSASKGIGQQKRQKPIKPIIPPKTLVIILKEKPEKQVYNRRIIDYKHSGLLQRYIGLGGKILPRRQTRLTAKQQRFVAKTIKTARVMGLLPFVSKERSFFK
jgi:small subunit ribosomal protein S18